MRMRFWLILPALLLCAADVGVTLAGQPQVYWAGDYSAALEGNPLARPFLAIHPTVFVLLAVAWGAVLAFLIFCWRNSLVVWLTLAVALGHAIGGSSWLTRHGVVGWVGAIGYLAGAAELCRKCWQKASKPGRKLQSANCKVQIAK